MLLWLEAVGVAASPPFLKDGPKGLGILALWPRGLLCPVLPQQVRGPVTPYPGRRPPGAVFFY